MRNTRAEIDGYIGSRIRESRLSRHLTQEQLARALGISFQQIQNYERGANGISAVRLFDICKILNVSLASIFPPCHPKRASHAAIPLTGRWAKRAALRTAATKEANKEVAN